MNNPKALLYILFTGIHIFACSNNKENLRSSSKSAVKNINNSNYTMETLATDSIYSFELDNPSPDTLKLVSQSSYFYYCFGKFSSPNELKKHFKETFSIEKETTLVYNNPDMIDTLYRVKTNNGFIKFLFTNENEDDNNNIMALVFAKVTEPSIQMTNGLKVGLNRNEIKKILFKSGEPKNFRNYNNIVIATALYGVWVHLNFKNDRLNRIVINTDYQVNKE